MERLSRRSNFRRPCWGLGMGKVLILVALPRKVLGTDYFEGIAWRSGSVKRF